MAPIIIGQPNENRGGQNGGGSVTIGCRVRTASFVNCIREAERAKVLVVQPRMGFSGLDEMRRGLEAVSHVPGFRAGTLTVDSFTRLGLFENARQLVAAGERLNGYPIVTYAPEITAKLLAGHGSMPVQVRHGSPHPEKIFAAATAVGVDAIEGGPVSYCLPYSRDRLVDCVHSWSDAAAFWANAGTLDRPTMMETFGGCMMGQLSPPSMLLALSLLEGKFFADRGIRCLALSYAQGTSVEQDVAALRVLRRQATRLLPDREVHSVFYCFMGLFPQTPWGARSLIEDSARVAVRGGAQRLIVKTAEEAKQIPSVESNVRALLWSQEASRERVAADTAATLEWEHDLDFETRAIIDAVCSLDDDIGVALIKAFEAGLLDVPFCSHPANANQARAVVDEAGALRWRILGGVPLPRRVLYTPPTTRQGRTEQLLSALGYTRAQYDRLCIVRCSS